MFAGERHQLLLAGLSSRSFRGREGFARGRARLAELNDYWKRLNATVAHEREPRHVPGGPTHVGSGRYRFVSFM